MEEKVRGAGSFHAERDETSLEIPAESMRNFRLVGIAAVSAATALVNGITETKWGVSTLPVADALNGKSADSLDTIYSTVWAGITSAGVWRRTRR